MGVTWKKITLLVLWVSIEHFYTFLFLIAVTCIELLLLACYILITRVYECIIITLYVRAYFKQVLQLPKTW